MRKVSLGIGQKPIVITHLQLVKPFLNSLGCQRKFKHLNIITKRNILII